MYFSSSKVIFLTQKLNIKHVCKSVREFGTECVVSISPVDQTEEVGS